MNKKTIAIICIAALCVQQTYTMGESSTGYAQAISAALDQLSSAEGEAKSACAKRIAGLLVADESMNDLHDQRTHPALSNENLLNNNDVYRHMPATWIQDFELRLRAPIIAAAFSADGNELAIGGAGCDSRVVRVNPSNGQRASADIDETQMGEGITLVAYNADNSKILLATQNVVKVYDANTHALLNEFACVDREKSWNDYVVTASFSPDGQDVIVAAGANTSGIYNLIRKNFTQFALEKALCDAKFSPDNSMYMVAALNVENPVHIVDRASGQDLGSVAHESTPCVVGSFSSDSQMLVTGSYDKTAKIVRIKKQDKALELLHTIQHGDDVLSVAFSPKNHHVITTSADKTARVTDVATGEPLRVITHNDAVLSGAFSPRGIIVATASADNTMKITNLETGETESVIRHKGRVNSAAFSPKDDEIIVTASDDYSSKVVHRVTGTTQQALAAVYLQWCNKNKHKPNEDTAWFKQAMSTYPDVMAKAIMSSIANQ